jgi:hypothetical protein
VDERILLSAINRGVPIIAADRDQNKPPIRQLLDLSESIYTSLMGAEGSEGEDADEKDKQGSRFGIFGR